MPDQAATTATTATDRPIASCSFCHKPSTAVKRLIAGPGVFICNECVGLSATIVAEITPEEAARLRSQYVSASADEILNMLPGVARSAVGIEAELGRLVGRLREQGTGWERIGEALGTSAETARQRFEAAV